ncbi:MAG: hypothetical protein IKZ87_06245 [Actinomycetaceae bacterium]|nr:hypothetical protein [Actinomycetaceae bacterium]
MEILGLIWSILSVAGRIGGRAVGIFQLVLDSTRRTDGIVKIILGVACFFGVPWFIGWLA